MSISNIKLRKSADRGHADHGWLQSNFTFSFAEYFDPKHMGYRSLRVINDDVIHEGQGFGMHPHKDMEIISYVVEGELEHKDSMGNGSVIKAGHVQKMSAGTGVTHSEFNPSKTSKMRLLQIWILPEKKGLQPSYQELKASVLKNKLPLTLVASNNSKEGVIHISQDVRMYLGSLNSRQKTEHVLEKDRGIWIQMIKGQIDVNGIILSSGDGASIENETSIQIQSLNDAKFLLFDLR